MKRHRVGIGSSVAMLLASGAVVAYAVTADGYKAHEAQLNDGGIWVVNGAKGIHGRINKPINQLDGVVPEDRDKLRLDVVQDGAAVVAINVGSRQGRIIDPRRLVFADGGTAALPEDGDVELAGGTLATVERASGKVWATRVDTRTGRLLPSQVDRQSDELAAVGGDAALAVTQAGSVVTVSAEEQELTTLEVSGRGFADPAADGLPDEAGAPDAITAVGERVVTLDSDTGQLAVADGADATLPEGSVLQQAGPAADAVLVATPEALLSVDLESGESSVVAESSGKPVEPVRLGSCVYGAWSGGLGAVAVRCGESVEPVVPSALGGQATELAFRVNRGEIVLNDSSSGAVWDVDRDTPIKIANWNAFTSKKQKDDEDEKEQDSNQADRRPPLAKPDSYGVRPGRTTVLHPLDNDSAPEGRLLSIVDVAPPGGGARAEISPDGQTIVLTTPDRARPVSFDYFIDDGRSNLDAHASIDVAVRDAAENAPPAPRKGYKPKTYKVPARGSLSVPVTADWRDDQDGDTLLLESATAMGGEDVAADARTTADGRIRFTAPQTRQAGAQNITVEYTVTDGRSAPVRREIDFAVQAPQDQRSFPATAEPDVVRGEVGSVIKIRPLLNDLPGSDPSTPNAELAIGGRIPQQAGTDIATDVENGVISFEASKAGTYFLDYDAAYGNAPLDKGAIRIDVKPRAQRAKDPVAMPDTLTLFGQSPGLVDVLANDLDPSGGLLVVQQATPDTAGQLDVAIVDGRWLRISARQPDMAPRTQTLEYTISNGARSGVRGEVVVTQRPEPRDNTPVTVTDRVVVRAGSSVSASVLDNDISPSGDRLSLVGDVAEGVPGELRVVPPVDVRGDIGRAYVSGRLVRYVAPSKLDERDTYEVPYVATNASGATAPGRLLVTVVPADEENTAPEPPALEGRVVSGDLVKVRLPGSGIDAEGDPVTVTGITSAPSLGRIVSFGGNFIEYQAYPRTVGTDTFSYAVVDAQGAIGVGTARVALVAPGTPQPPLAVADRLTVEPGRTATFDPLANDFIAPGDDVEVRLLEPPAGVELDPGTNLVTVRAPDELDAAAVQVVYELDNGLAQSRSTMTLETAEQFDNPPVVYDAFGRADDSGSVVVDVLEGAYDPDGRVEDLSVVSVHGEPTATIDGGEIRVERAASPKVVPFRVEDGDGAASTASLYVPPTGSGLPYVRPDALIEMGSGKTVSGKLGDYVVTPEGSTLRLTGRAALSTSPALALTAEPSGARGFSLSSSDSFRGPGALLVEVTTAQDPSGNEEVSDPSDGFTATLSIPVQVGDDAPVLECPRSTIPISAGEAHDVDIATYCKVFTLDPRDASGLTYDASWTQKLDGVDLSGPTGSVVRVQASDDATGGGEAVLDVRAGESNTEQILFRLARAPSPRMLPVSVSDLRAGESRTINLSPYLEAGVSDPTPTVVSVTPLGDSRVRATASGSRVTLTAAEDAQGRAAFRVVMSDVDADDPPTSRRAEGRISFEVRGVPSQPGPPVSLPNSEAGKVKLSWRPPADNGGSPITHYEVRTEGSNDTQRCRTNVCTVGGLENGRRYVFRVRGFNKVGPGPWSDRSLQAVADTKPGRVENIRMTSRGDGQVTIAWDKPRTQTSRILDYTIVREGAPPVVVPGDQLSYPASGLDNNRPYTFSIKARNKVDYSDARTSAPFQSVGNPVAPSTPTVTDQETGSARTDLRIGWNAVLPEGPGPTTYTVHYNKGGGTPSTPVPGCTRTTSTSCVHSGIDYNGTTYKYSVTAYNDPGKASAPSAIASFEAVGRPAAWGSWSVAPTGSDQQVQVIATAPNPRGSEGVAAIIVGGQVVRELDVAAGQGINEVVNTPSNESAYQVQLRICNENAARGGCTTSDVKTVQSHGPLDGHLNEITNQANGRDITWTISGSSNGNPASLRIRIDGGVEQVVDLPGTGAFSITRTITAGGYNEAHSIDVVLFDPSPARGSDSDFDQAVSGDPPPPSVTMSKGDACRDGDLTWSGPRCQERGYDESCTQLNCAFLNIAVSGFLGEYSCQISRPGDDGRIDFAAGGDRLFQQYHYGFNFAWGNPSIVCRNAPGHPRQEASASTSW